MPKPDAGRIDEAQQRWLADNISKVTDRFFELGKFLVGISSASIGLFIAISKIPTPAHSWEWIEWAGVAAFLVSGGMGVAMVLPSKIEIRGVSELQSEHEKYVNRNSLLALGWGGFWVLGVVLAGWALVASTAGR